MNLPFSGEVLGEDPIELQKKKSGKGKERVKKFLCKRASIAKEWCISCAQLPQGYIWLPLSCCFAPPTAHLTNRNSVQQAARSPSALNKFALNFGLLIEGALTTMTGGCCCCGFFTTCSPEDMYD